MFLPYKLKEDFYQNLQSVKSSITIYLTPSNCCPHQFSQLGLQIAENDFSCSHHICYFCAISLVSTKKVVQIFSSLGVHEIGKLKSQKFLSRKVLTLVIIIFINAIAHLFTVDKKGVV